MAAWLQPQKGCGVWKERLTEASKFREDFTEAKGREVHGESKGKGTQQSRGGKNMACLLQYRSPRQCRMGSGRTSAGRSRKRYYQKGNTISLFFFNVDIVPLDKQKHNTMKRVGRMQPSHT